MNPGAPIVFVVDDDPSLRRAVTRLLASMDLRCEAFGTAAEFLARVRADEPGCLVLDVRLPGLSGLDLQEALNARGIELPIVFVTAHGDVPLTVRAMKAGALEVLTKPFDDQQLLDVVHQALALGSAAHTARDEMRDLRARYDSLTPRERQVMTLVARGLLNKQVAAELGAAEKTIKVHRGQVMRKMDAASFSELVRMADRLGLVSV